MNQPIILALVLLIAICVPCFQAKSLGYDIYQQVSDFTCLKNTGIKYIITRGYEKFGQVDPHAYPNLIKAYDARLTAHIYMFPCNGKDPALQAQELVNGIPTEFYDTVFIDIEDNPAYNCGWSSDFTTNCQFLTALVAALQTHKLKVGIYCSQHYWVKFFGAADACANFSNLDLWYPHYDNDPSFDDWPSNSFGKWSQPKMKQYKGDVLVCGVDTDLDYMP